MRGVRANVSMIINPYVFGGGGGGSTLFDELTADGPNLWWRCNDATSSTTMVAQAGSNGTWTGTGANSQAAIYSGGPTCVLTSASSTGAYSGTIPALNELSLSVITQFTSVSGMQGIVSNDDGVNRHWQMRANGSDFEFVKINIGGGSVVTVTASGALTTAVQALGFSVSAGGVITLYVDGSAVQTSAATGGFDYGTSGTIQIGAMTGGGGATANCKFSEVAIFDQELSGARFAAYATAAGL